MNTTVTGLYLYRLISSPFFSNEYRVNIIGSFFRRSLGSVVLNSGAKVFSSSFVDFLAPVVTFDSAIVNSRVTYNGGKIVIMSTVFRGIHVSGLNGGAVYIQSSTEVSISSCTFHSCWTDSYGGAIFYVSDNSTIVDNCFSECRVTVQRDNPSYNAIYTSSGVCDMQYCSLYQCGKSSEPGSDTTIMATNGLFQISNMNITSCSSGSWDASSFSVVSTLAKSYMKFMNLRGNSGRNLLCYIGTLISSNSSNIINNTVGATKTILVYSCTTYFYDSVFYPEPSFFYNNGVCNLVNCIVNPSNPNAALFELEQIVGVHCIYQDLIEKQSHYSYRHSNIIVFLSFVVIS